MATSDLNFQISQRVTIEGNYATVRFVGEVSSQEGLWLGVEWDNAERGKHDGVYNGIRYFSTKNPTGGSLVRPKKVSPGISCFEALQSRYGLIEGTAGIDEKELFIVGKDGTTSTVEFVGAEKLNIQQSEFSSLIEVVLPNMSISDQDGSDESSVTAFTSAAVNVRQLCLARNLITKWSTLAALAKRLPHLELLDISENHMEPLPPAGSAAFDSLRSAFKSIEVLVVRGLGIDWTQLQILLDLFLSVKHLKACYNQVKDVPEIPEEKQWPLTLLDIDENLIDQWTTVLQIVKHMPSLEVLQVSGCPISRIYFDDCPPASMATPVQPATSHLSKLRVLVLKNNLIDSWQSINELVKLASLKELRFSDQPLCLSATPETVRQLILARLLRIHLLNRTLATRGERRGAEIDYLKRFGKQWMEAEAESDPAEKQRRLNEFISEHPTYLQLIDHYGPPESGELASKPQSLKNQLLEIEFQMGNDQGYDNNMKMTKKVPATMTVQKLKGMIGRMFKITLTDEVLLVCIPRKTPTNEIPLDNALRQLSFYSVESGDIIRVNIE